jgi:flagellar motor protein MotB
MTISKYLVTVTIVLCCGIAHAGSTTETVFFLSDDLRSATLYYNSRLPAFGSPSFVFPQGFNHDLVMYARPENYHWKQVHDNGKDKEVLFFPDTNNYAYLMRDTDPKSFLVKVDETHYKLIVDGSFCRGDGCRQDENIVAVVMPKKFKVTKYNSTAHGTWKVVGNTYTCYARQVKGNSLLIEFEDTIPYVYVELAKALARFKDIKVSYDGSSSNVSVAMPVEGMFAIGGAEIEKNAYDWLSTVTDTLKKAEMKEVRVEGHSDNVPIRKGRKSVYPSNWELSAARAARVVRYLVESGLDPQKLAAVGYADSRPAGDNKTLQGRAKNRRIEFTIIPAASGT